MKLAAADKNRSPILHEFTLTKSKSQAETVDCEHCDRSFVKTFLSIMLITPELKVDYRDRRLKSDRVYRKSMRNPLVIKRWNVDRPSQVLPITGALKNVYSGRE